MSSTPSPQPQATLAPPPPPGSRTSAAGQPERYPLLDAMRLIGAYGVVWLHTLRSPDLKHMDGNLNGTAWDLEVLGRFGVPLFAGAAAFFCVDAALRKPRPLGEYTRSRAVRLLIPFLAWLLIYGVVRLAKQKITGTGNYVPGPENILNGNALQTWFLTFIFFASVGLYAFAKAIRNTPTLGAAILLVLSAAATGSPIHWVDSVVGGKPISDHVYFLSLGFDASGTMFFGAALPFLLGGRRLADVLGSSWRKIGIACIVGAAGFIAADFFLGRSNWAENLAGIALLVAGILPFGGPLIFRLAALGGLAFGVYLSHILFMDGMQAVLPILIGKVIKGVSLGGTWWWDLLSFVVACGLATLTAVLLRRSTKTAWLAG